MINQLSQNKNKKYVSPLEDELNLQTERTGTNVIVARDEKAGRLFLDINYKDRSRGISSSGKNALLATATYRFDNDKKLSLNLTDPNLTDKEMDKVDDMIKDKARRKRQKEKLKKLEDVDLDD